MSSWGDIPSDIRLEIFDLYLMIADYDNVESVMVISTDEYKQLCISRASSREFWLDKLIFIKKSQMISNELRLIALNFGMTFSIPFFSYRDLNFEQLKCFTIIYLTKSRSTFCLKHLGDSGARIKITNNYLEIIKNDPEKIEAIISSNISVNYYNLLSLCARNKYYDLFEKILLISRGDAAYAAKLGFEENDRKLVEISFKIYGSDLFLIMLEYSEYNILRMYLDLPDNAPIKDILNHNDLSPHCKLESIRKLKHHRRFDDKIEYVENIKILLKSLEGTTYYDDALDIII